MTPVIFFVVASLVAVTVWGFVSPRGQWRVLAGWSRRASAADEPGSTAIGLLRFISAVGIVILVTTGCSLYFAGRGEASEPGAQAIERTPIQKMWGGATPVVVNRVIIPVETASAALVKQPILGYQVVDGSVRNPAYLFRLPLFAVPGADDADAVGYIGQAPQAGYAALDSADLVVQVTGDRRCIPQQAVVTEAKDSVSIGVFYGQPNPTDGSNTANLGDCTAKPSKANSVSTLLSIGLNAPLGARTVTLLDGSTLVPKVKVIEG